MNYDNQILTCKSANPFYDLERYGRKPNTIRVVNTDELLALGQCRAIHIDNAESNPRGDNPEPIWFERDITGMFDVTSAMKDKGLLTDGDYSKRVVIICWQHPSPALPSSDLPF